MVTADRDALLKFARSLKENDLLFLRFDITKPEAVDDWVHNIETGQTVTVLVEDEDGIIGYGSLHHKEDTWTRHLGQIRILVTGERRRTGLGRKLATEVFRLAKELKLERVFAQMAADQPYVRQLFEALGFKPEALLTDWLMARDGRTHDLLIMSHYVDDFGS
jgi:RimJ/RimL family protein N-acetyltransferase